MSTLEERFNKYKINSSNNSKLEERFNKYKTSQSEVTEKEDNSILKTASAGLQYLGQGTLRGLEAVFVDTPLQIAAGTRNLFGDDKGAKGLMEASNVSLTNALINTAAGEENNPFLNNNQNLWNKEVDKNSYIKEDNLAGKIISATGEMLPTIAIGGSIKGGPGAKQLGGNIMLGSKAFSGATNEAYQESGDIGKSMLYGLGSAGTELLTEKISGGIPGLKQINGATKKEIAKNYLKSMVGEGAEEVIASLANPLLQTTYKGADALKQYGTSDYWKGVAESGVVGAAVGGLLDSPNTISSLRNNQLKTTANSNKNTQNGINTLINDNNVENSAKYNYLPTNNEKSNNLRQSASNYFNNSQETINMINTIDKVVQDKGYNVLFDNTIVNSRGESVNAQIKALDNGEIEIKINPNSERAGEFLLCHEITHAIETNSMKELVMDYASKHSDFNESLESLKQSYGTNEVTDEVLADISGQLFGNQEFINNLSMKQPNVFKRIYNKIVELANKITGNSKEGLFIKNLKNKWETAYRNTSLEESINNLNDSTKYSTIGLKGAKNLSKNSDSRYYKNMLKNYHNAVDIFNSSNENLETTNIKSKQETGWFQTKYGDWSALISDENSKMLQKLEPNKTYKLGDILEHELLYEAYPELQKLKIKTADIETTGGYASFQFLPANTITDEIYIRNSDLNKKDFRKTLLHEINHYIQHKENYDKRSRGTNSKIAGVEDYRNNLGEIISNETKINADLTQEELDAIILPEQAKENPQYKNIREKLLESNRNDLLKNGDDNNALQNLELPIQNKIQNNKVVNKKDNNSGRIINDNEEFYEENSNENIEQTNEITDKSHQEDTNGIEELENSSFSYDNQGRKLTKEQQEYFKDSKAKDENGNLKVLYHGTPNEFNKFSYEFLGTNGTLLGKGFYLTDDTKVAEAYANKGENGKVMELYADIKKPLKWGETTISKQQFQKFVEAVNQATEGRLFADYSGEFSEKGSQQYNSTLNDILMDYEYGGDDIDLVSGILNSTGMSWDKGYGILKDTTGYDGIIVTTDVYDSGEGNVYIPFQSNQIKNIDNTNPTSDADIRYSQQNDKWQEYVEKNYKSTGTKTDMKKHLYPLETAQIENKTVEKLPTAKRDIPQDPTKESSYDNDTKKTRKQVGFELLNEMGINEQDIAKGNDISSIDLSRTDPIRVNEKVFGAEIGQKINDATINKTKHNEAERTRWLNKERNEIKELGIKSQSKESAAVQKYGEKQYITRNNEVIPYGDAELARDFPDVETQNKIKKAAKLIRNKYDNYIEQINEVLVDMGYNPIKKRPDYMRHFQALNDVFSRFGTPLNAESMQNDSLPTDINGLTDQFKPGKQYFANAMQRMGLKTEYDAITGIDGYLEGASNLIYHTKDIQRYRTLSKLIRETYGSKNGYEDFESMTPKEQEQRIADIQSNKLAKYSAWLDEQANALAGKKGKIDRGTEELFGRKVYTVLQTAKKQVGSNMTGFNVRSALTNFASAIQGASKTNKMSFLKGTMSTINNIIHNDGLIDKSDFLTSRFGSDSLSPKLWQKMSNAGQIFMKGSDYFTANQVWRSKYFENLSNGMNESEAIRKADDFASRIMGDRSKGSTATIFNSNTLGFLTQFQLEVNNQWSSLIHDNKMDIQRGNKTGASVVFQLGQLFAMSYMFNSMMKSLTGSGVMLDPIELLKKIFNPDEDEEKTLEERTTEVLGEVVNNVPFASIFTGGRIPISEAFDGVATGFKFATGQTDEYGNKYTLSDVGNDVIESAFYWLLPTGYGQAKKTIKGASMYSGKLPTAGSYTNSGNLRFTADKTPTGVAKALTFGQYSSKEAQDYIDSGFKTISKNQIQEMKDLGITSTEYRKLKSNITQASKTTDENNYILYFDKNNNTYWYDKQNKVLYDENYQKSLINVAKLNKASQTELKLNYIDSLDNLTNEQKNILANNLISSDSNVDEYGNQKYILKKYDSKGNSKEYNYWYDEENNILYDNNYNISDTNLLSSMEKATSTTIDMKDYSKYNSYAEMKYSMKNPTNYSMITSITTYDDYITYKDKVAEIKEKYSGTNNTNVRKQKVFEYINSLSYNKTQKVILFNMLGGYEIKNYKNDVHSYINGLDISKSEKEQMWQQIYGK